MLLFLRQPTDAGPAAAGAPAGAKAKGAEAAARAARPGRLDVHPRFAMQILRHSKIAVTMEIYTEAPRRSTREALEKPGQWLDSDS